MIGSRIELITSERGKELALVNLYKHRFVGYRKKDGALKWRCSTNKNCTTIIFSTPEVRRYLFVTSLAAITMMQILNQN